MRKKKKSVQPSAQPLVSKPLLQVPDYFGLLEAAQELLDIQSSGRRARKALAAVPGPESAFDVFAPSGSRVPSVRTWTVEEPEPLSSSEIQAIARERWATLDGRNPSDALAEEHRHEWDFSELRDAWKKAGGERKKVATKNLHNCFIYELARESATLRLLAANLLRAKERGIRLRTNATQIQQTLGEREGAPLTEAAYRDWNVAFFLLLRALRRYEPHGLVIKPGFPHTPWLAYRPDDRPTTASLLPGSVVAKLESEDGSLIQAQRQLFSSPSGIFDRVQSFVITVDTDAGRKEIDSAVRAVVRKRLQEIGAASLAGASTVEDGLRALSALRLMRLTERPWIKYGAKIGKSPHGSAPLGDRKLWRAAAMRTLDHLQKNFRLSESEKPLTWLEVE